VIGLIIVLYYAWGVILGKLNAFQFVLNRHIFQGDATI